MQITYLATLQAADILETSEKLAQFEGPGASMTHILHSDTGRDIVLVIDGLTGDAMMFDECKHDGDSGGSVHHHARD